MPTALVRVVLVEHDLRKLLKGEVLHIHGNEVKIEVILSDIGFDRIKELVEEVKGA